MHRPGRVSRGPDWRLCLHRDQGLVRGEEYGHEKGPLHEARILYGGIRRNPAVRVGRTNEHIEEIGIDLNVDEHSIQLRSESTSAEANGEGGFELGCLPRGPT